ncbi:MAG: peptidoglycan-binding protein [Rhizobiaceae bacterium]
MMKLHRVGFVIFASVFVCLSALAGPVEDFNKAEQFRKNGNNTEAVIWYRKAAEQGNAAAQYHLGKMYSEGKGVEQAGDVALQWFLKAGKQGHPEAIKAAKAQLDRNLAQVVTEQPPTFDPLDQEVVRTVQLALNREGYNAGKTDGKFGKKTAGAISSYQSEWGLIENGEITEELLKQLDSAKWTKRQGKQSFDDNSKYEGELRTNRRHGFGVYTYANGSRYEGEWRGNHRTGKGTLYSKDGGTYEGFWRLNKPHGKGVYKTAKGRRYSGNWREGCLRTKRGRAWINTTEEACKFSKGRTASSSKSNRPKNRRTAKTRSYGGKGLSGKRGKVRGSIPKRGGCAKVFGQYVAASGHSAYAQSVVVSQARYNQSYVCGLGLNRKNVAAAERAAIASCLRGTKKYKSTRKSCIIKASK